MVVRFGEVDILVPNGVRRIFIPLDKREFFYGHDVKKDCPDLAELRDRNLLHKATPLQMYELLQMPHPTEYGLHINRHTMLSAWNDERGTPWTAALGLPIDDNYPYINKYAKLKSIRSLKSLRTGSSGELREEWWHIHDCWAPLANLPKALSTLHAVMQTEKNKPKRPKSVKVWEERDEYFSDWNFKCLQNSEEVIMDYLKSHRTTDSIAFLL